MSDKSMRLEQAMFILRHGSAEGEHKYFEAISVIEKAYNRLKAENKNCGVKIQNQREQLKACNEKIKEQQAEIERLTPENERLYGKVEELSLVLSDTVKIRYKEAKSEALKEFSERLKEKATIPFGNLYVKRVLITDIDNLLKEMGCGE